MYKRLISALLVVSMLAGFMFTLPVAAAGTNIARQGTISVPHSNGGVSSNINNGVISTSYTPSTTWNTWGATQGTESNPFYVTLSWDQPYELESMKVMWWVYTDNGVHWPRACTAEYLNNGVWVDLGAVGLEHKGDPNMGASGWVFNDVWNEVVFPSVISTSSIRLRVIANKGSGTSPGFGINEWEVYGHKNPASADLNAISPSFLKGLTADVVLPSAGASGSVITWSGSTSPEVLSNSGAVVRPVIGQPDVTGKITASASNGDFSAVKEFDFSVISLKTDLETVMHDLEAINLGSLSAVKENLVLPAAGEWGSTFLWNSGGSANLWNDGTVLRPPLGEPSAAVTLTVTASFGTESKPRNFDVTVASLEGYKQIVSAEELDIKVVKGSIPELPRNVRVTYADGATEMRRVRWENNLISWEDAVIAYDAGAHYEVKGIVVGDASNRGAEFETVAHITVTADKKPVPSPVPSAKPLPLHKVTLDGNTILTTNRTKSISFFKAATGSTSNNSILYNYRRTFALDAPGSAMGGWSASNNYLRGHAEGHMISALSLAYASTGKTDAVLKEKIETLLTEIRRIQLMSGFDPETQTYVSEAKDFTNPNALYNSASPSSSTSVQTNWSTDIKLWGKGYISAYAPDQFKLVEDGAPYNTTYGVWAPYYTLHKQLSGFIDAYVYAGSETGLEIAKDLGSWVFNRLSNCTTAAQRTRMWGTYIAGEYGGMNEALARLYEITGNADYLECAKMFDNTNFFNSLSLNRDNGTNANGGVRGRHANQHVPQIVGAVKEFAVSGDEKYYNIAENFWNIVDTRYAHSVGGVGRGESFRQPYDIAVEATYESDETCATYNMLKVTKDLYAYTPDDAKYMDYYERAMMNHIVGSLDAANSDPHMIWYKYALRPSGGAGLDRRGATSWSCCNGTSVENHVKYQEAAYYVTDDTVYVGLYMPTTATWDAQGATLRQECLYPAASTKITVNKIPGSAFDGEFDIKLRVPYWASAGYVVKVNGVIVAENPELSTYISVGRQWKDGDVIEVSMPFSAHLDIATDKISGSAAGTVMYGPVVMAIADDSGSSAWKTLTLDSYLGDESLIKLNGPGAGNIYSMTVNGRSFVPRYSVQGQNDTYFRLNITGDGAAVKNELFDTLKRAHLISPDDYSEEMFAPFAAAVSAAVSVYQDSSALQPQVDEQVELLLAAISRLGTGSITSVAITGGKGTIDIGESVQFTAAVIPADAEGVTYAWSASVGDGIIISVTPSESDPAKVTVKGLAVGAARLRVVASQGGYSVRREFDIAVKDPNAARLEAVAISGGKDTLEAGETDTYTSEITPNSIMGLCDYAWSVSAGDSISVGSGSSQVNVTGLKSGKATLKLSVTYDGVTISATREITVKTTGMPIENLAKKITYTGTGNDLTFTNGRISDSGTALNSWNRISAVNDGVFPALSNCANNQAWATWGGNYTMPVWIEYNFGGKYDINSTGVFWNDNDTSGSSGDGGIKVPKSWTLEYWDYDLGTWKAVTLLAGESYGTKIDVLNTVSFAAVFSDRVRIVIPQDNAPTERGGAGRPGICEWEVWGKPANISADGRVYIAAESIPGGSGGQYSPSFLMISDSAMTVTLIAAEYGADGRLISSKAQSVSLEAGVMETVRASIPFSSGNTYRFFIWDSGFRPLTAITSADGLR